MRYSKLFPKTEKDALSSANNVSSQLLYRGGFIRESSAGRYYFLPLGLRVQQKIMALIKREMDDTGAQEMITPVLHPFDLWKETNRNNSVGFELITIKDRHEAEFVLGGTGEEMFVELMRKFQISYKDLPLNIYQFSAKFRDELRVRGGLLRVREFMMKDAYSFDRSEEKFKNEYQKMWQTYKKIYDLLGLKTYIIESDNGYIGGEYCHEFVVESELGESTFFVTEDGSYGAHEDIAVSVTMQIPQDKKLLPIKEVEGKGLIGVDSLAKFLKIPVEQTTKTILFETDKGDIVAAAIRGDFDINETKLIHIVGCTSLELASEEVVRRVTGAEVGYAGVLNLPKDVRVFFDRSTKDRTNFEMGANKTDFHTININFGRDLPEPERFYDFKLAKDGHVSADGKILIQKKGIEVGNIFQLGYHYTNLMKGATFTDEDGKEKPYYMGCYGIGVGRTLATIVEKHNDQSGIMWPESIAPYKVHLVGLNLDDKDVQEKAELVYSKLNGHGVEVLFDDRKDISAGEKFADADLIGIPYRLVISKKTEDKIEMKKRNEKDVSFSTVEEILKILT
ncbi:MAG: proline--tRNA ligase [Candidatus Roizmanbacteria bacterium]